MDAASLDAAPRGTRLRDLLPRARVLALVAGLLLLVPIGASLGRAVADGWVPSNDEALIVLRSRDVVGPDRPLVGQPSTAGQYATDHPARHPGPIEFYLLTAPVRLLGPTWGTLLTVAAITAAAVLITAWVALRHGGPAVGLGAVVLLALAMWSSGTAVLTDPISSNVGGYPLLAGVALAWALWLDDRRLWPLAAAVWSFAAQQHLAVLGPTGVVVVWGALGAVVATVRRRRRPDRLASSARWGVAAIAVAVLCWLPPLVDQVTGSGNLAYILGFGGSEARATLGPAAGLRAAGRAVGWPPFLLRRDVDGGVMVAPYDSVTTIGAVAGVVALVACGAWAGAGVVRRRRARREGAAIVPTPDPRIAGSPAHLPARCVLAVTGLVVLAAGVVTTANVPDSVEQVRINFYRWAWPAAIAAWGSLAWAVLPPVRAGVRRRAGRPASAGPAGAGVVPVAVLAVVALVVGATAVGDGVMDQRRDERVFAFEAEAAEAVLDVIDRDRPVHLVTRGSAAFLAISPALAVALEDAGVDVRLETTDERIVDEAQEDAYGAHRLELAAEPGARVFVVTGVGSLPDVPGEVVAREALGVRLDRLVAEAGEQVRGADLVVSPDAQEILDAYDDPDVRGLGAYVMALVEENPEAALRSTLTVDLLRAGYFTELPVDAALLDQIEAELDRGVEVWGDDRFAVSVELLP